jgi:two-component system phosphate regulon sensor histidine kinase PhoR
MLNMELQKLCDDALASPPGESGAPLRTLQIGMEKDRTYDVTIVRLPGGEKGAVVVLHDISALKRLEKVRRDFVANVSHELTQLPQLGIFFACFDPLWESDCR